MSLGDIAAAMQGITQGVDTKVSAMRARTVEDQTYAQRQAELERYTRLTDPMVDNAEQTARYNTSRANVAVGTEEGNIDSANVMNEDTITKYQSRLDLGVPQNEALAEMTDAERRVVEDHLANERATQLMEQGVPEKEARAKAASNDSSTSDSQRNIAKNQYDENIGLDARVSDSVKTGANRSISDDVRAIQANATAKAMGLDRTMMWAEQSEANLSGTQDNRAREDILTDELNGVYADNAIARKSAAQSTRRMAEIQESLVSARQKSGFDMTQFARQNANEIMQAGVDAAYMAGMGGEAAVAALPLINMDADGNGKLDFEGATSTAIKNIEGVNYLVAVDDDGNVVPSSASPDSPGMKVAELAAWHSSNGKGGSSAAAKPAKQTPLKFGDVKDLNDFSFDIAADAFSIPMVDSDEDGVEDTIGEIDDAVSLEYAAESDQAEKAFGKMQRSVAAFLAKAERTGGSVAETQRLVSTPEDIARNVFGVDNETMDQTRSSAEQIARIKKFNAYHKENEFSITSPSSIGGAIASTIRGIAGEDRDDEKFRPTAEEIQREVNTAILKTIGSSQER